MVVLDASSLKLPPEPPSSSSEQLGLRDLRGLRPRPPGSARSLGSMVLSVEPLPESKKKENADSSSSEETQVSKL